MLFFHCYIMHVILSLLYHACYFSCYVHVIDCNIPVTCVTFRIGNIFKLILKIHTSLTHKTILCHVDGATKTTNNYERKQLWSCGLHHWKERGEVASELRARPVYFARKCCFNFLYKSLWGYKKPQHYHLKRARILSCALSPTAHVSCLFQMIDTKLR